MPPAVSTVRELDAPAAICDALIWCASASASEALLAASISRRSFFLARASCSYRPLRLLALSLGEDGGMSGVENRAANTVSSAGSTDSDTLVARIVSMSARRLATTAWRVDTSTGGAGRANTLNSKASRCWLTSAIFRCFYLSIRASDSAIDFCIHGWI